MKRGTMPLVALITILLLTLGGIYIAYIIFNGLRDSTSTDVTQLVPGIPQDIPRGVAVVAPKEVMDGFNEFIKLLEKDTVGPCIAKFDWSKLKDFQVEMQIDGRGTLFILRSKDGQQVTSVPTHPSKKKMCVVGGSVDGFIQAYNLVEPGYGNPTPVGKVVDGKVTPIYQSSAEQKNFEEMIGLNSNSMNLAAQLFYLNWIKDYSTWSLFGGTLANDNLLTEKRRSGIFFFTPDYVVPERIVVTKDSFTARFKDGKEISTGKNDENYLYVPKKSSACIFGTYNTGLRNFALEGSHVTPLKKAFEVINKCN